LADELRRVLSDDGLLSQHADELHPVRSIVMPVKVSGDPKSTYYRTVRFNRLTHIYEGMAGDLTIALLMPGAAVVFPLGVALAATVLTGTVYAVLGLRRGTVLLSFIGIFLVPLEILAGIFVSEFEWAARHYRLNGEYDVDLIDQ
jgi:hypothetical protein